MQTVSLDQSVAMIPDGASLMIGGFMAVGTPERVIDEIVRQNKRDLTVIANDTAAPGRGIGKLVDAKLLRKVDREPYRSQPRNPAADDGRRIGGRTRAAGYAHRTHPRRRLWAGRHPDANRHRHAGRGRQATHRSGREELSARESRCAPTLRWCRRSLPTIWAI